MTPIVNNKTYVNISCVTYVYSGYNYIHIKFIHTTLTKKKKALPFFPFQIYSIVRSCESKRILNTRNCSTSALRFRESYILAFIFFVSSTPLQWQQL